VKRQKVGRGKAPAPAVGKKSPGRHYVDATTLYPNWGFYRYLSICALDLCAPLKSGHEDGPGIAFGDLPDISVDHRPRSLKRRFWSPSQLFSRKWVGMVDSTIDTSGPTSPMKGIRPYRLIPQCFPSNQHSEPMQ